MGTERAKNISTTFKEAESCSVALPLCVKEYDVGVQQLTCRMSP
jgi:hypothetical protein